MRTVCERALAECPSQSIRTKMCEGLRRLGEMYLAASQGAGGKDAPLLEQINEMVNKSKQNESETENK